MSKEIKDKIKFIENLYRKAAVSVFKNKEKIKYIKNMIKEAVDEGDEKLANELIATLINKYKYLLYTAIPRVRKLWSLLDNNLQKFLEPPKAIDRFVIFIVNNNKFTYKSSNNTWCFFDNLEDVTTNIVV